MVATMTEPTPPSPAREAQPIRLPLTQLKRGDRAVVADAALSEDDRAILRAMGLDESCTFTVCRAGSGGPCIIQVDATRLGLSPDLARRIMTRPCECPDAGHCAADGSATSPAAPRDTPPPSSGPA
jgi:Fe2+ transport system protein FeoA